MRQSQSGITLYELLITTVLLAAMSGIAIPQYQKVVANSRIRAELDTLFHAVHVARKESIMRREVVTLCPSRDAQTCATGREWSPFWIMFHNRDADAPAVRDPGEPLLQVHRVSARIRLLANRSSFTLRATQKRATNGTLVACDRAGNAEPRALVISYTGRPRVARETPRGDPYACPD